MFGKNMKTLYYIIALTFSILTVAHAESKRQTPSYYTKQFNELSSVRINFAKSAIALAKNLQPSKDNGEYSNNLLSLKHKHIDDLVTVVAAVESILDGRPSIVIKQELTRDLDGIGRYTDLLAYGVVEISSPGGDRHLKADRMIEYLLLRAVAKVNYCEKTLLWDYDFPKLLKDIKRKR